jgi:ribosome-associated protein
MADEEVLEIGPGIRIPRWEVAIETSRASGPGGQHVNKTETRVVLRFWVAGSRSIPEEARARIMARLAPRLTKGGELLVACDAHRERSRNLAEAYSRLVEILKAANRVARARKRTKPSRSQKQKRLDAKRRTADVKIRRKPPKGED